MSYRPMLIRRAQNQFADLIDNHLVYDTLMERIIRLVDAPWAPSRSTPTVVDPEYRETEFGEHGLLSFRVDDDAELLITLQYPLDRIASRATSVTARAMADLVSAALALARTGWTGNALYLRR